MKSAKTADIGMYDAMFAVGLRLPLTALHRQLAIFLGLPVSQIAPNVWKIFIGAEILWGRLNGGEPLAYFGRALLVLQTPTYLVV